MDKARYVGRDMSTTRYNVGKAAIFVSHQRTLRGPIIRRLLKFTRSFTAQQAVDALDGLNFGSGSARSFVSAFIKNGYLLPVGSVDTGKSIPPSQR